MNESIATAQPTAEGSVPFVTGYRVLSRIGHGAFGTVWLAVETLTGLHRAVKTLPKQPAPWAGEPDRELRGLREYQQVAQGHPNLLQIFHVGETDDCYFYAMELADAEDPPSAVTPPAVDNITAYQPSTLAALITKRAPLAASDALAIVADVLRGLQHLHVHGLIHRDVKPSNVIFVGGRAKLADVGLVANLDQTVTRVGTPGYMPPEGGVDAGADLYAVGIMLYEMLTGLHRSKFPELPRFAPRTRIVRRQLRRAIRISNRAADWIPSGRYRSADDFLKDVLSEHRPWPRHVQRPMVLAVGAAAILLVGWLIWPRAIAASLIHDAAEPNVVTVRYTRGATRLFTFPTPVNNPVLVDFEGRRRPFLVVGTGDERGHEGRLLAIDPAGNPLFAVDHPVFDVDLYVDPPAAWSHQPFSRPCRVDPVLVQDVTGDARPELVVAVTHKESPVHFIVFTRGWQRLCEYWHYGQATNVKAIDLCDEAGSPGADGLPEVVISGIANERPEPTPFAAIAEPYHFFVMMLNPRHGRGGVGHWSMNAWMNQRSPESPVAYGYIRQAVKGAPAADDWSASVLLMPGSPLPFRLDLQNGWLLELDAQLRPVEFRENGNNAKPLDPRPSPSEVWHRLWPPDED